MKKDIYFYWGNETMSFMRYMTLMSFCFFNPDWVTHLIKNDNISHRQLYGTVEKQDKTEYKGPDYSHLLSKLPIDLIAFDASMIDLDSEIVSNMSDVHIKDILNWKILSDCGGIVADMDIIFIRPMGNSIEDKTDVGLICFDGYPKKDYIPVSFMYSSGDNEFFSAVYKNALKNYTPDVYESCGTLCIPEKNLNEIKENFPNLNIQKLKDEIAFPFTKYEWNKGIQMLYNGDNTHLMRPGAVGIHWYGGAPLSQSANNKIDDKTVFMIDNTITLEMRKILYAAVPTI